MCNNQKYDLDAALLAEIWRYWTGQRSAAELLDAINCYVREQWGDNENNRNELPPDYDMLDFMDEREAEEDAILEYRVLTDMKEALEKQVSGLQSELEIKENELQYYTEALDELELPMG